MNNGNKPMTLSPEFEAVTYSAPSDSSLVNLEQVPYETKEMTMTLSERIAALEARIEQVERRRMILSYSDDYCHSNGNYDAVTSELRALERERDALRA